MIDNTNVKTDNTNVKTDNANVKTHTMKIFIFTDVLMSGNDYFMIYYVCIL